MRTIARSKIAKGGGMLSLAHEALTRRADERDCLGEEPPHGVAERDRLLVRRSGRLQLRERGAGQFDCRVQSQRGELLALGLVHGRSLLFRELPQAAEEILGIPAEREVESAFHLHSIRTVLRLRRRLGDAAWRLPDRLRAARGGADMRRPSLEAGAWRAPHGSP